MEEGILRASQPCEILDIIHDQHVNRVVEIEEIRHFVVLRSVLVLQFECIRADIDDTRLWIERPNLISDRVCEVGLPHSASAIDEERVEGCISRLFSDSQSGSTRQLIRLSGHEGIEGIEVVQLRVKILVLPNSPQHRHRLRHSPGRRQFRSGSRSRINEYTVLQFGSRPEDTYDSRREERQIILLNILRYELRFNLEDQHSFRKLYGHDRREPCPVSAACKVVSQDGLTLCPLLLNRLHQLYNNI